MVQNGMQREDKMDINPGNFSLIFYTFFVKQKKYKSNMLKILQL